MSISLSNAAAAAKAAKADLGAPVAANNGQSDSAATTRANGNGNNNVAKQNAAADNSKSTASQTPAKPAQGNPPAQAVPARQAAQNGRASNDAAAPADEAPAAATVAPLFAQLLNLTDLADAGAEQSASGEGDGKTEGDDAAGSGSAAAGSVLPAMVTSMLNLAAAPVAQPATTGDAARSDTISAVSTLSNSATRLNLAAASVAVNPTATPVAEEAAPAPATIAPGTPQNVYTLANNASLAAAARQGAATDTATQPSAAATDSAAPVPGAADTSLTEAPAPAVVQNAPRVAPRATDVAAASSAAASTPPVAVTVTGTKDDGASRTAAAAAPAPAATGVSFSQSAPSATPAAATVKLAGSPDQWQQPLREALGDRLQVQLQRNNDHAVIRLEPPNMGSIEISIRHSAGALQVNLSASNSEVVRQLNTIGDSVRQDLSTRQFAEVAVTVSSSRAQAQADTGGRGGQQRGQDDSRTPGRALSEDDATSTFAMTERE